MADLNYKIELELRIVNGKTFLNYWDIMGGADVVAEVRDGKLFEKGNEITLQEFTNKVIEQVKKW